MAHIVERAKTGRAKCRGCGKAAEAGALRFGERLPNPFADDGGEMTHWFHLACAAFMRPESFLSTLPDVAEPIPDRERLQRAAELGVAHRRLPRATAASRAPSGRAACRSCKAPIAKGSWRIALMYYEDGRFVASGFIHAGCARAYLETTEVLDRLRHFSAELSDGDLAEIGALLEEPPRPAS
jgi:ribosomal protein L37AE/L43A